MMKKWIIALVLSSLFALQGNVAGQPVEDLLKEAKPATGAGEDLMKEARQPLYYEFKLDTPIPVYARSVAADERGNRYVVLEVRSIKFSMDPMDNHLTAVASIVKVGVAPLVRAIHVALYDKEKRLIGTGSCRQVIEAFATQTGFVGTPSDEKIDLGESPRYFAADSFQVVVMGRGRSEYRYSEKDIDELIRRLGDESQPEAQSDAAMWLVRLGEPVIPRLSVLTKSDKPVAFNAIWVLGEIGGNKVADVLASVLADQQRSTGDRSLAARGLGNTGEAGVKFLAKRLEAGEEDLLPSIFAGLAKSRQKEAAKILSNCLLDSKKYYGKTRVSLIVNIQDLGDPIAIPALIQALKDPTPRVRPAAARTLEKLAKHSIPIRWGTAGPSELAWLNAPLEAREAAVKEWEKWWEENKSRFGG